jgi:hypothetical protein
MPSGTTLVGIQLVYCEDGVQRSVWLDLSKVQALSWSQNAVKAKPKGQKGNAKLPTDPAGPGPCVADSTTTVSADTGTMSAVTADAGTMTATADATTAVTSTGAGAPVCWWNGNEWVCGDDV